MSQPNSQPAPSVAAQSTRSTVIAVNTSIRSLRAVALSLLVDRAISA